MNVKQIENRFIEETADLYDQEEAGQLFYLVIEQLAGLKRSQLMMMPQEELPEPLLSGLLEILSALKQGDPVQYLLGEAWFYGSRFLVNPSVLIPRPETEELVDWILSEKSFSGRPGLRLLDIGTGSGCIAISLKKHLPNAKVAALDVSGAAIQTAAENAALHKEVIQLIHDDIFSYTDQEKYDLIVSNPPYIRAAEGQEMRRNVLEHEPHLALFVSNENPLIFYAAIADFAARHLQPRGKLYFEINESFGQEMIVLLEERGFQGITLKKDMQGKDRMISCSL